MIDENLNLNPEDICLNPWSKPWTHVSVSQVSLFRRCARLWALSYGTAKRPPSNANQQKGIDFHIQIENWLTKGVMPTSPVVMQCIKHWPNPQSPGVEIEKAFSFDINEYMYGTWNLNFVGKIDVLDNTNKILGDHKFTKSFANVKSPQDLRVDLQACAYAFWAKKTVFKDLDEITLKWVYSKTQGKPETKEVLIKITSDIYTAVFLSAIEDIKKMAAIALAKSNPWQIAPCSIDGTEYGGCFEYGRCYFKDKCGGPCIYNRGNNIALMPFELSNFSKKKEDKKEEEINSFKKENSSTTVFNFLLEKQKGDITMDEKITPNTKKMEEPGLALLKKLNINPPEEQTQPHIIEPPTPPEPKEEKKKGRKPKDDKKNEEKREVNEDDKLKDFYAQSNPMPMPTELKLSLKDKCEIASLCAALQSDDFNNIKMYKNVAEMMCKEIDE